MGIQREVPEDENCVENDLKTIGASSTRQQEERKLRIIWRNSDEFGETEGTEIIETIPGTEELKETEGTERIARIPRIEKIAETQRIERIIRPSIELLFFKLI